MYNKYITNYKPSTTFYKKCDLFSQLNPDNSNKYSKDASLNECFFFLYTTLKLLFDLICQILCEMIFRTAQWCQLALIPSQREVVSIQTVFVLAQPIYISASASFQKVYKYCFLWKTVPFFFLQFFSKTAFERTIIMYHKAAFREVIMQINISENWIKCYISLYSLNIYYEKLKLFLMN